MHGLFYKKMPQKRALETLTKLCVSNIIEYIDLWCVDYVNNYFKENLYQILIGPFHEIRKYLFIYF